MEKTVVEELNPSLTYRIGKSIPAGDSYCEHIISICSSEDKFTKLTSAAIKGETKVIER